MSELPFVDLGQMERLNEWGGADLQKKMVELFLTHAKERLDQIKEGVATKSPEKAETGAHTLKSSAGNVGAQRVQALASDAEALAEAGKMDEVEALLPAIEREFEAACGALREVLKEGEK
ncbi:MAG: Hpt domain-containing protein [Gemmatimonadetes bacterium]|nr:Hpt domain-containing protein [Gemmatimonadota bacterium]NNM05856.1 Hpt domain-containing protein [Gemmatimonadota bacterium]